MTESSPLSTTKPRLLRHLRLAEPPRMRLTERDAQVIKAVSIYRVLRRDQLQRLFFPSVPVANRVLVRLFQHGFLDRRFVPREYGQGDSQALYLLGARGADLLAAKTGDDRQEITWRAEHNQVGSLFLDHTLAVNDVRIAVALAAQRQGWQVERWLDEVDLKSQEMKDYVDATWTDSRGQARRRRLAVVADGYFVLYMGDRRAHFFVELDQATVSNKRWADKVRGYLAYTWSGKYEKRYQTRSLRILTVTTGEKRLQNLKATTEQAGGKALFWFATLEQATPEAILTEPIWQVADRKELHVLTS